METPHRRWEDGGGISHEDRHKDVETRLARLENRDLYFAALLAINTMLTAGDLVTKVGPVIKTFSVIAMRIFGIHG